MRTFIVFHEDYGENTRSLDRYCYKTLQSLLDDLTIDYDKKDTEESALAYINAYNGDGDHYWMISEIIPGYYPEMSSFKSLVS